MFKFGFTQKLASLCFVAISVAVLLSLNFPAEAEVNSPTPTVLDMEEMSQIAGGSGHCYKIGRTSGGTTGDCSSDGSICFWPSACGTNPYTYIFPQQYCSPGQSRGHHDCTCYDAGRGWKMYNCQICIGNRCKRSYSGSGGSRIECTVSGICP